MPVRHPHNSRSRTERNPLRPGRWTPAAMKARLSAQESLRSIPRRQWGVSAEARAQFDSLVARVDRGKLAPEMAADHFRSLTVRLVRHRKAVALIRNSTRCDTPLGARSGMP